MAKVSFYFRGNLCTAHCCSMRCTRTHIYRCKIALLTPTSWDTLYAYKAKTRERGIVQLIMRLKVDRANKESAERGQRASSTWKSDFATKFRAINRLFTSVDDRSLHVGARLTWRSVSVAVDVGVERAQLQLRIRLYARFASSTISTTTRNTTIRSMSGA